MREGFDLVFLGDVLIHTLYPLKALAALAPLCRGTLVFAGVLPEGAQEPPAMIYIGGSGARTTSRMVASESLVPYSDAAETRLRARGTGGLSSGSAQARRIPV